MAYCERDRLRCHRHLRGDDRTHGRLGRAAKCSPKPDEPLRDLSAASVIATA